MKDKIKEIIDNEIYSCVAFKVTGKEEAIKKLNELFKKELKKTKNKTQWLKLKKELTPKEKLTKVAESIEKQLDSKDEFILITKNDNGISTITNMFNHIEILGTLEFAKADFIPNIINKETNINQID